MNGTGNGTARKALISGGIGLAFAVLAWGANSVMSRLDYLEHEAARGNNATSGFGGRIDRLESQVERLRQQVEVMQMRLAGRRGSAPPNEWE